MVDPDTASDNNDAVHQAEELDNAMPDNSSERPTRCEATNCCGDIASALQSCLNCRKDVEASLTRIGLRKARKLAALPSCSIKECAKFLKTVRDTNIRAHLACIAWWRFSVTDKNRELVRITKIIKAVKVVPPMLSMEYMHKVLKVLKGISSTQIAAWFGHTNIWQIASTYSGGLPTKHGKHCTDCIFYHMGCTDSTKIGADDCTLWNDPVLKQAHRGTRGMRNWSGGSSRDVTPSSERDTDTTEDVVDTLESDIADNCAEANDYE